MAAAALIAAQCPGGQPVDMSYGPEAPMPVFPSDLRALADEALARIVNDEDGLASNWVDSEDWKQRRAILTRLRAVLAPPPRPLLSSTSSRNGASLSTEAESEPLEVNEATLWLCHIPWAWSGPEHKSPPAALRRRVRCGSRPPKENRATSAGPRGDTRDDDAFVCLPEESGCTHRRVGSSNMPPQ